MIDKEQSGMGESIILYPRKDVSREIYSTPSVDKKSMEKYIVIGDMVIAIQNAAKDDVIEDVIFRVIDYGE